MFDQFDDFNYFILHSSIDQITLNDNENDFSNHATNIKKKKICDENEYAKNQKNNDNFAQEKIDNFTNSTKMISRNLFEVNLKSKSKKNINDNKLKNTNKKIQQI